MEEEKEKKVIVPRFNIYVKSIKDSSLTHALVLSFEDRLTEKMFNVALSNDEEMGKNPDHTAERMTAMLKEMIVAVHKEGLIEGYDVKHHEELKRKKFMERWL